MSLQITVEIKIKIFSKIFKINRHFQYFLFLFLGTGQNKASHFHCLKCNFVCTDTNKVVAHRRQHQKLDSIHAAGFKKFSPGEGKFLEPFL